MPDQPLPIPNDPPPKRRRWSRRRIIVLFILLLLASPLLACAALAARFYTGKPNPTHDYYADYNALREQFSEEDRAWGLYMAMRPRIADFYKLRDDFEEIAEEEGIDYDDIPDVLDARPGDPFYPTANDVISQTTLLDEIRAAARRPIIGTLATDRYVNDPPASPSDYLPPSSDPAQQESLMLMLIMPLGDVRDSIKILAFDAHSAVHEGDHARAVANIVDIVRIAGQAERERGIIADLVAIACVGVAQETTLEIVNKQPSAFNDDQLHDLTNLLLTDAIKAATIDFEHERMMQHDVIQRIYTDDGQGNGRLTSHGLGFMDSNRPAQIVKILAPIAGALTADRRSQSRMLDSGIESAQRLVLDPATHYPQAAARLNRLESTAPGDMLRYIVSRIMEPGLAKAAQTQIQSRTKLRATATRLALERYKLAQGHYPDTLNQLVPTYLPELPADPFNPGHPLNDLLRDGTPYIYSVGSNGIDNQATPAPPNTRPDSLKARFADPNAPSPDAPAADWILSPLQD